MFKGLFRRNTRVPNDLRHMIEENVSKYYVGTINERSDELRIKETQVLLSLASEMLGAKDGVWALRQHLRQAMVLHSHWQVLALTPAEKKTSFYKNCKHITCGYFFRLDALATQVIIPKVSGVPIPKHTNDTWIEQCNSIALAGLARLSAINVMRPWVDDFDPKMTDDWFRDVYVAHLILAEFAIQRELGLASSIDVKLYELSLLALSERFLLNSHQPILEWREAMKDTDENLTEI